MQSSTFRILLLLSFWIFFPLQRDAFFLLSFILIAIECIGLNGTLLSMWHGSEDIIPVPFMVEQEWTSDMHFSPILCAPQPFFNHSVFKMYSGLFNRAFYGCTSEKKNGKEKKKKAALSGLQWWPGDWAQSQIQQEHQFSSQYVQAGSRPSPKAILS